MSAATTSIYHDLGSYPWVVEFTEPKPIEKIDPRVLRRILDVWLKAVAPGARLIEPEGCGPRFAVFRRRDDQREFIRTFGGGKLAMLPTDLPV